MLSTAGFSPDWLTATKQHGLTETFEINIYIYINTDLNVRHTDLFVYSPGLFNRFFSLFRYSEHVLFHMDVWNKSKQIEDVRNGPASSRSSDLHGSAPALLSREKCRCVMLQACGRRVNELDM